MPIKLDKTNLNKVINNAFDNTVERLSEEFDRAIVSEEWDYPRPTKRKSGQIARSPRDIVDTGELLESKVIARSSSSNNYEFSWDVDYAAAVHDGYTLSNGCEVPPRPWTERAMNNCDVNKNFSQQVKRYL